MGTASADPANAEDPDDDTDDVDGWDDPEVTEQIAAVEIVGNERTRDVVIYNAARVRPGDPIDAAGLADIRQRVLNLKLFVAVDIEPRRHADAGVDLVIRVKERWTLFPLPFVSTSARGTQVGLVVLESNLLGGNKLAALGGSYASFGYSMFGFYRDPSISGSRYQLFANALYSQITREQRDGREVIFSYDDQRVLLTGAVGYLWTRWLTTSLGWFATYTDPAAIEEYPMMFSDAGIIHGWLAEVAVNASDFKLFYEQGLTATVRYRHAIEQLGAQRDLVDVTARVQYARALIGDQATSLAFSTDYVDGDAVLDTRLLGGRPGTRGFTTGTLWAERAYTASLEHQIPVLQLSWSVWTLNGFVDAGQIEFRDETTRYINPGVGLRLYLPRVSFPALGVDVTYSIDDERPVINGSLGLSM